MDFAHGEPVTRLRPALVVNPYADEAEATDWDMATSLVIPGCGFNPGSSVEPTQDARSSVVTTPEVYAPVGADIESGDRLVVRGNTYDVDGAPAVWRNPFTGWAAGVVVGLRRVEG